MIDVKKILSAVIGFMAGAHWIEAVAILPTRMLRNVIGIGSTVGLGVLAYQEKEDTMKTLLWATTAGAGINALYRVNK